MGVFSGNFLMMRFSGSQGTGWGKARQSPKAAAGAWMSCGGRGWSDRQRVVLARQRNCSVVDAGRGPFECTRVALHYLDAKRERFGGPTRRLRVMISLRWKIARRRVLFISSAIARD
jgi:hypothetical protein